MIELVKRLFVRGVNPSHKQFLIKAYSYFTSVGGFYKVMIPLGSELQLLDWYLLNAEDNQQTRYLKLC